MSEQPSESPQSPESCPICHDVLHQEGPEAKETYTLPECKHEFHVECILPWFRGDHSACPYCRNAGMFDQIYSYNRGMSFGRGRNIGRHRRRYNPYARTQLSYLRRYARRKEAPEELKKAWRKLIEVEKEEKLANKQLNVAKKKYRAYRKRRDDAMKKTRVYQEYQNSKKNFDKQWNKLRRAKQAMEQSHRIEPMIVLQRRIVDVDEENNIV